jgi:hypothetical protein
MQLTEQHFINKNHKDFNEIDQLAFYSKNLYNRALYLQNQAYQNSQLYVNYNDLDKLLQKEDCYKQLPAPEPEPVPELQPAGRATYNIFTDRILADFDHRLTDEEKEKVKSARFQWWPGRKVWAAKWSVQAVDVLAELGIPEDAILDDDRPDDPEVRADPLAPLRTS